MRRGTHSRKRVDSRGQEAGARPQWALGWEHQFTLIGESGRYLTRWWLLATPIGGLAVHRMDGPDARQVLHDHPFGFLSFVVRGGYTERRLRPREMDVVTRTISWFNAMPPWGAHYISRIHRNPTWTLVLIGPQVRRWGFWQLRNVTGRWRWTEHQAFDSGHEYEGRG